MCPKSCTTVRTHFLQFWWFKYDFVETKVETEFFICSKIIVMIWSKIIDKHELIHTQTGFTTSSFSISKRASHSEPELALRLFPCFFRPFYQIMRHMMFYCIARQKLVIWLVNPRSIQSRMDLPKPVWTWTQNWGFRKQTKLLAIQ